MSKTCLVLEGGAMRGIYTAGVLDFLMEQDIKIDAIIGVSAGALFGCNYVSNQPKRSLRYNLVYAGNKNYMGLHSLITTGNIVNKDFCFNKLVNELDPFDFDTFDKSKTKFYSVVTNVETGEAEYLLVENSKEQMDYLRASGSMPLLSQFVELNGNKYLDGAVADSIPLKKALEMGYDKVIVVNTRYKGYVKKKYIMFPFKLKYKEYPKFIEALSTRHIRYNDTLKFMAEESKKGNIFAIYPSSKFKIKKMEKNKAKINQMYNLGYSDMKRLFGKLKDYLDK